jgi:hypothetical protein
MHNFFSQALLHASPCAVLHASTRSPCALSCLQTIQAASIARFQLLPNPSVVCCCCGAAAGAPQAPTLAIVSLCEAVCLYTYTYTKLPSPLLCVTAVVCLQVRAQATCEAISDTRTDVNINGAGFRVAGPLKVPLGIKGTGYVDWLYLDESLRVTRGSKGSLFVHVRDDDADV